jgi:hypothetical protein
MWPRKFYHGISSTPGLCPAVLIWSEKTSWLEMAQALTASRRISLSGFCHAFRQVTGKTPTEFVETK